jgi:prepilin-type N-terminal cleavage/methylation domain-containing protein
MPAFVRTAFTLIELLVVVTIIVVLLALLTPALDRAIYSAELVVCGSKLKGIVNGATLYAGEFRRSYPARPWVETQAWRPNWLWYKLSATHYDERTLIRPYVASIDKQLQCPMVTELNLDQLGQTPAPGESNAAYTSYQLWYSWGYRNHSAMKKLGQQFSWTEGTRNYRFDVLASDYDLVSLPQEDNFAVGSHPDQGPEAKMQEQVWDNKSYAAEAVGIGLPGTVIIFSRWGSGYSRGPVDLNFAHQDGSVRRMANLVVEDPDGTPDDRVVRVPETADNSVAKWKDHLPPTGL